MSEPRTTDAERHQQVQKAVLGGIFRLVIPILIVAALASVTSVLLSSWGQPLRVVPASLGLVVLLFGRREAKKGRSFRAAGLLMVAIIAAFASGMLLNGGLRAPIAGLTLFFVAFSSWSFGRRAGTLSTMLVSLFVLVIFVLDRLEVLPAAKQAPLALELASLLNLLWLTWSVTTLPQERLRDALSQSFARERELAQEQLRSKEAQLAFKAVFDQTAHLMMLVSPAGVLLNANRVALEALGAGGEQEVLGLPFEDTPWWRESERGVLQGAIQRVIRENQIVKLEPRYVSRDGKERSFSFTLAPFHDEAGQLRYLIAEGKDVTELLETKEREERKHRLELVGQLAGGIAHDFNNILASTLASTEILKQELQEQSMSADLIELTDLITSANLRARDLIRRLMTFARRGTIEKKNVSLSEVIDETTKLLSRTLPANIKLRMQLGASRDIVFGNSAALSSALMNLALNARDAMPKGGELLITTEEVELDEEWCQASGFDLLPGRFVKLSVKDAGHGIPHALQQRVFEPFFTTKPEGRGNGLGLSSVYGVVREHQGAVYLYSEPDNGASFHICLPLIAGELSSTPNQPMPTVRFDGIKALLVDDEKDLRLLGARLLGRLGIQSTTAEDAEAGLAAFQKEPSAFDLAVLDIVLPGKRGTTLALELLELSPKMKVLLVSGFQKEADLDALPKERVRMLSKPFTFDALQRTLAEFFPAS